MMVITFGGKWMLKPYDRRNWCLYEWRVPDPKNPKTKSAEPKWFKMDEYFQSIRKAVERVLEYEVRDDPSRAESGVGLLDKMDEIVSRLERVSIDAKLAQDLENLKVEV